MLTIFSTPKPFAGHIGTIQRNAIQSWKRLRPEPEILLFGDEPGAREAAAEFGLRHVPEVGRNEFGTPLVSDVFEQAQRVASHGWVCYINCDIILLSDFAAAFHRLLSWREAFLMVGQCWDVAIEGSLDFRAPGAEEELRRRATIAGRLRGPDGFDFFAFPRGFYRDIPPFAVGRFLWDGWLLWRGCRAGVPVVDVTAATWVIHQHHEYPGGWGNFWKTPEALRNRQVLGGYEKIYTLEDASHRLTSAGVKRNAFYRLAPWRRYLHWKGLSLRYSVLGWTKPMRYWLGLHREGWLGKRLGAWGAGREGE